MRLHSTVTRQRLPILLSWALIGALAADISLSNPSQSQSSAAGLGSPVFDGVLFFRTGKSAAAATVNDFDGDGKPDIAWVGECTTDSSSREVFILIGNGQGGFKTAASYPTGECPRSVISGDFNADGKQDLATANSGSRNVSILLGRGDGSFKAAVNYSVGIGPVFLTASDLNNDAKPDLIAACSESHSFSLLMGNGDGTFNPPISFSMSGEPKALAVGDFNADGRPDVAVIEATFQSVSIWIGDGYASFRTPVFYSIGSEPKGVKVSDLNADGKLDLAVICGSSVFILLGSGNGTFNSPVGYSTGTSNIQSAALDDVNGDRKLDLVCAGDRISILPGKGDGTFPNANSYWPGGRANWVVTDDFNGDRKRDLSAGIAVPDGGIAVLPGGADGSFPSIKSYPAGTDPRSIAMADWNRDGIQDLATANNSANAVTILLGRPNGSYEVVLDLTVGNEPRSLAAVDFNQDGNADLAVANRGSNKVAVILGQGDGTFLSPSFYDAGISPSTLVIGDFNADGKPDVAVANELEDGKISILLGAGKGTLRLSATVDVGPFPGSLAMEDYNGDAKADLAISLPNDLKNNIKVLLGKGDGTFQNPLIFSVDSYPDSIAAEDFNADGEIDLAVKCSHPEKGMSVVVLRGNGDGTFKVATSNPMGFGAKGGLNDLVAADLNEDSIADLALIAGSSRQYVSVLLGRADGNLDESASYPLGNNLKTLAVGLLNKDKKPDLAAADSAGKVFTLLNIFQPYSPGCPEIWLAPASLPNGTVGEAYDQPVIASGGIPPYTFAITSGSLPQGMSLVWSGKIIGTPTAKGVYSFAVTATDAHSCSVTKEFTLYVRLNICPTITLAPTELPNGTLGVKYDQLLTTTGGSSPYQYSIVSGILPIGLTLAYTGTLSGTPTSLGNYAFEIRAKDADGCTGTRAYSISVLNNAGLAEIISPTPSSLLTSTWVTFIWLKGTGASQYWLYVGRTPGGYEFYSQDQKSNLAAIVLGLPNDGSTIYVRLWSKVDQDWKYTDCRYTTCTGCTGGYTAAQITSPAPGSEFKSTNVLFKWNAGAGVSQFWLYVSKTPGGSEIYNQDQAMNLSVSVAGLPSDGSTVHLRLWSLCAETWIYNDYSFKACTGCAPAGKAADISIPEPGSELRSASITFEWNQGVSVSAYQLHVGRIVGRKDIYSQYEGSRLSARVTGLPSDGNPVYARLWSLIGDSWVYRDFAFKSCTGCVAPAEIITPQPGKVLPGAVVTFGWDAGTGAKRYRLAVGKARGGEDYYSAEGTVQSMTVRDLPTDGSAVYVRLSSLLPVVVSGGSSTVSPLGDFIWRSVDYLYIASLGTGQLAELITPPPGYALIAARTIFSWSVGTGVAQYRLTVGRTLGGREIYDQEQGENLSKMLADLPQDGKPIYIRLWSLLGTSWRYIDYVFLAASTVKV